MTQKYRSGVRGQTWILNIEVLNYNFRIINTYFQSIAEFL